MSRNKFKFRREIIAAGGITSTGGLQITAASTFVGAVTFTAAPIFTAGVSSITGGLIAGTGGYLAEKVQTLQDSDSISDTGGVSGTAILGYGVTKITVTGATGASTAGSTRNDLTFKLNPPIKAGVLKEIWITGTSASTKVVSIKTATSTHTFFGTTKNSVAFTTAVSELGFAGAALHLRGLSTTQWAVSAFGKLSTAAAFAGANAT